MDVSLHDDDLTPAALAAEHRRLGTAATRLVAEYAAALDGLPVCSGATAAHLRERFAGPLPERGTDALELLDALARDVVADATHISSPRYFGLFNPAPLPVAVWTDAVCSALNQNAAAWRQSPTATALEERVLRWLCDLLGYGDGAFGTLTSGGSEANLIGLKCARDAAAGTTAAAGLGGAPLRVYASEQAHFSLVKGVDMLGIGRDNLRRVGTDARFRVRVGELRAAVERDLAAGLRPACVVGVAGTTSSGAVDPLDELADVAAEYGLWFHVDAAYGGALAFSARHGGLLRGVARADSATLDPHKWMFVPFSCGALLTRDGARVLRDAFDTDPAYLDDRRGGDREPADGTPDGPPDDGPLDFFRLGPLGTRRANALKLWAALAGLGRDGYRRIVERQLDLTRYLAAGLAAADGFEPAGDVQTAVCCVRYLPAAVRDAPAATRDAVQRALQQRVERGGRAWVATTVLDGRRALRINVNGFLTRRGHVDELVALLRAEGPRAAADVSAGP
ncbi:pyridoxal-dependent decarboxylase [Streptomyces sp. WAC 06738]|uniref:pyridoxal phosphate-dependent decarboxylase family protein n=1 Tax=Streptomyces sp. WAC 06738 TaxID=2203210 RepID=UPI000F7946C7|nr:pyridoxal-dependent decarboxylase [Streptomyces sp. WAC 06738]